jgi:uncharacterized protein YbjQ (UPF0145 family)
MSVQLFSSNYFDTQKQIPLGAVFGKRIEAISLFRGFAAGIQGLFGGQIGMVEKKIQDVVEGAKADCIKDLQLRFPQAQAIIGLQIQITDVGRDDKNQFILATVQGTAIGSKQSFRGGSKTRKNRQH